MSCDETQASDFLPSHAENCPAHMQPLYLMHSSLPGSGYEVYQVLFAVFHMRPGVSQPALVSPPLELPLVLPLPPLALPPLLLPALPGLPPWLSLPPALLPLVV